LKVTETVQELLYGSEVPQVLLLMAKSLAFVPVIEKLLKLTDCVPVLVSVAVCAELVVPTVCVAKVRLEVKVRAGGIPASGWTPGSDSAAQAEFAVDTSAIDCGSELGGTNHSIVSEVAPLELMNLAE
jgi:hypothetical protein